MSPALSLLKLPHVLVSLLKLPNELVSLLKVTHVLVSLLKPPHKLVSLLKLPHVLVSLMKLPHVLVSLLKVTHVLVSLLKLPHGGMVAALLTMASPCFCRCHFSYGHFLHAAIHLKHFSQTVDSQKKHKFIIKIQFEFEHIHRVRIIIRKVFWVKPVTFFI